VEMINFIDPIRPSGVRKEKMGALGDHPLA